MEGYHRNNSGRSFVPLGHFCFMLTELNCTEVGVPILGRRVPRCLCDKVPVVLHSYLRKFSCGIFHYTKMGTWGQQDRAARFIYGKFSDKNGSGMDG